MGMFNDKNDDVCTDQYIEGCKMYLSEQGKTMCCISKQNNPYCCDYDEWKGSCPALGPSILVTFLIIWTLIGILMVICCGLDCFTTFRTYRPKRDFAVQTTDPVITEEHKPQSNRHLECSTSKMEGVVLNFDELQIKSIPRENMWTRRKIFENNTTRISLPESIELIGKREEVLQKRVVFDTESSRENPLNPFTNSDIDAQLC